MTVIFSRQRPYISTADGIQTMLRSMSSIVVRIADSRGVAAERTCGIVHLVAGVASPDASWRW